MVKLSRNHTSCKYGTGTCTGFIATGTCGLDSALQQVNYDAPNVDILKWGHTIGLGSK